MPEQKFNNLDHYEGFIQTKISQWSPQQRKALAAGMAERWLPVYEQFSKTEKWGDPSILRQYLNSIWMSVSGQESRAIGWSSMRDKVQSVTPHMDDFDANEALCACVMIQYAIDCCTEKDNNSASLMAVLSGLEAVQPDMLGMDRVPTRVWKKAAIHNEISKQLRLVEYINSLGKANIDDQAIRSFLTDPQMTGEVLPREPKDSLPAGRTNKEIFEQYWQIMQTDLRQGAKDWRSVEEPTLAAMFNIGAWSARYSRRKQMLSGEYGPLEDQLAVTLLLEKNKAKDIAETEIPNWGNDSGWLIELFYNNPQNGMDANKPESPHAYGPSLRRLWVEARRNGLSDQEIWISIKKWAYYLPGESSGKNKETLKKTFNTSPAVQAYLSRPLVWSTTGSLDVPWKAVSDENTLEVRLNDFPDEMMYTLMINGEALGNFHDWPKEWERE